MGYYRFGCGHHGITVAGISTSANNLDIHYYHRKLGEWFTP